MYEEVKLEIFKHNFCMFIVFPGLVRYLLKSGAYTQCLLQADKVTTDAKGELYY